MTFLCCCVNCLSVVVCNMCSSSSSSSSSSMCSSSVTSTQWSLYILFWVRLSWVGRMGGWTNCFSLSLFIVYRTRRTSSSKAKRGGAIGQCFVYNSISTTIQELTETALDASSRIRRTLNVFLPGRLPANSPLHSVLLTA